MALRASAPGKGVFLAVTLWISLPLQIQSGGLPCKLSSDKPKKFSWGYISSAFTCPKDEADDSHIL